MHLVKDENGSVCPHGHEHEHTHQHTYEHNHAHAHQDGAEECHEHPHKDSGHSDGCTDCSECSGCTTEAPAQDKVTALLDYMQKHNEQHALELDHMAAELDKLSMTKAAEQIRIGVTDFQKGNMHLSVALSMVKEKQ